MLLAGDIGGTKTSLALISPELGPRALQAEATFPSARYPSLEALVQEFLAGVDAQQVDRATFGVAGPVVAGEARITNLPWVMNVHRLQEELHLDSVRLLNDLVAIAHAVPFLQPGDLHTLNAGRAQPGGTLAVIAPGTGLGEAFLTWDGARYRPYGSEGGHADFAPADDIEIDMLRYLQKRLKHVSWEWVCSGKGIPNIYAYLRDSGHASEPAWLAEQLAAAPDATPVIINAALGTEQPSDLCLATVQRFISILGAEAGNMALKVLATGGVYIAGGIPLRIRAIFQESRFLEAFTRKGRLAEVLEPMPVHIITNPKVALLGAAYHGLEDVAE